jgi:hypothetical protein
MNLRELDIKALIAEVREVAAEHPTRVLADDCQYFDESGAPVCLIGHALARLGFSSDTEVGHYITLGDDYYNESSIGYLLSHLRIEHITGTANRWLTVVQRHQDLAEPWAVAVARADKQYPGLKPSA